MTKNIIELPPIRHYGLMGTMKVPNTDPLSKNSGRGLKLIQKDDNYNDSE